MRASLAAALLVTVVFIAAHAQEMSFLIDSDITIGPCYCQTPCPVGAVCAQSMICQTNRAKCPVVEPPPPICACMVPYPCASGQMCIQMMVCEQDPTKCPTCRCNLLCTKGSACQCVNGAPKCVPTPTPCCCDAPVAVLDAASTTTTAGVTGAKAKCTKRCRICPVGRR